MASAYLSDDSLKVSFSLWEKTFGLVRDTSFPLADLSDVSVATDGYHLPSGLRAPGVALPRRLKVGTWRGRGSRQLVSVRRGQPAVHVRVSGSRFTDLIIGADAAESLAGALRRALGRPH